MIRLKWCQSLSMLICLFFMTGCWDRVEINDLALVMAGGFDLAENGQIEVTLQIAIPQAPNSGQGGGKQKKPALIVSEKGMDSPNVFGKIQERLSRKLSFGHRGIIIIGEKYARRGLDQLDQLTRSPENRYSVYVLTAHGTTAKQILETPYVLEAVPATGLKKMQSNKTGLSVRVDELLNSLSSVGRSPVTGAIRLSDKGNTDAIFMINEAAVYQENKLVGFLTEDEMKVLQWSRGKLQKARITSQMEPEEKGFKGTVSINVLTDRMTINTKIKNEMPEVTVTFQAKGRVMENDTKLDLSKSENLQRAESKITEDMEKQIKQVFMRVQKQLKSDVFGLGEEIHIEHGSDWKKIKNQWKDIYPQVPVNIKVDVSLERMGRTQAPSHLKK